MKKLILTTVCALAMAGAAFAQGNIQWTTISAAGFTAQTNATVYSPLFGGGANVGGTVGNTANVASTFDYEMLYLGGAQVSAPTTLSSLFTWADAGLGGVNSGLGHATVTSPNTSAATVPWAAGTTDNIILVGWSVNLGANWLSVSNVLANWATDGIANAFFGISSAGYLASSSGNPGSVPVGGGGTVNGTPIQSLLTPLYLLPVPEPATLALAGLGGLAMLAFRRQRK